MKFIGKVNDIKKMMGYGQVEQVNEFKVLVEEVKQKYKKNEICIMDFRSGKGTYIASPKGSLADCKALIVPKQAYYVNGSLLKDAKSLEMVVIQEGVVSIPPNCFKDCKKLHYVYFPRTLESIGASAFKTCTALKDVIYDDCIGSLKIQEEAFKGCTGLEKISLNCRCCYVCGEAFKNCNNLKSVIINGNVKMNHNAFKGCNNLKFVKIGNLKEIMENQHESYFEDYVQKAYSKEKQINHSIGFCAPLEIKDDVVDRRANRKEDKKRDGNKNKYQSNFVCEEFGK